MPLSSPRFWFSQRRTLRCKIPARATHETKHVLPLEYLEVWHCPPPFGASRSVALAATGSPRHTLAIILRSAQRCHILVPCARCFVCLSTGRLPSLTRPIHRRPATCFLMLRPSLPRRGLKIAAAWCVDGAVDALRASTQRQRRLGFTVNWQVLKLGS